MRANAFPLPPTISGRTKDRAADHVDTLNTCCVEVAFSHESETVGWDRSMAARRERSGPAVKFMAGKEEEAVSGEDREGIRAWN